MTTIHSTIDKTPLTLDADPNCVAVDITDADGEVTGGCYDRTAFLDAVRSELGAIVIDKVTVQS